MLETHETLENNQKQAPKYNILARILHWLIAILIITVFSLGLAIEELEDSNFKYIANLYQIHKITGVIIFLLLIPRILNRILFKAPALPNAFKRNEVIFAKLGHIVLYLLMLIAPISGYLMSGFAGYPVSFGNYQLPMPNPNFDLAKTFAEIHEFTTFALIIVAVLHILIALKHRFFDIKEKNILGRML